MTGSRSKRGGGGRQQTNTSSNRSRAAATDPQEDTDDEENNISSGMSKTRSSKEQQENEALKKQIFNLSQSNKQINDQASKYEAEIEALKKQVASAACNQGTYTPSSGYSEAERTDQEQMINDRNLSEGNKVDLSVYVKKTLYPNLKFLNEDTVKAYPVIVEEAMMAMGVTVRMQKLAYSKATKHYLKYQLVQKRSNSRKGIALKYKECISKDETFTISVMDIDRFRQGSYYEADPRIKEKWCYAMLHFLPCITNKYNKWDIKKSMAVSEVTTNSDEALMLWFLHCYAGTWDKEQAEELQEEQEKENTDSENHELMPKKKRRKKEGQHCSLVNLDTFLTFLQKVQQARQDPVTGKEWDDALKDEAGMQINMMEQAKGKVTNAGGTTTHPSEGASMQHTKKKMIIPYEPPSESNLFTMMTNGRTESV